MNGDIASNPTLQCGNLVHLQGNLINEKSGENRTISNTCFPFWHRQFYIWIPYVTCPSYVWERKADVYFSWLHLALVFLELYTIYFLMWILFIINNNGDPLCQYKFVFFIFKNMCFQCSCCFYVNSAPACAFEIHFVKRG